MNDLFKIDFLQVISKDSSSREVPGDGMCSPQGKSLSDRHDLSNAICITHYGIYVISLVLYAPLTKRYMWCYGVICTTLHGIDVIYPHCYMRPLQGINLVLLMLYAPLFKGWT